MKIVKKVLTLMLIMCCLINSTMPAFATEIQPRYLTLSQAFTKLSIDTNGHAICNINVRVKGSSYKVEWSMTLNRVSGGSLIPLKSWSESGGVSFSIDKTYDVTEKCTYKVLAQVTVMNSNGDLLETVPIESNFVPYR